MRAAVGLLAALGACTPAAQSTILPAFIGIAVAPGTALRPDCTYWNPTEQSMRHAPDDGACVGFATGQTQTAVNAYSTELDRAGWRVIDQFGPHRTYEKTVSQGCTQHVDVTVYATTPPSNPESPPDMVIVFAPHDGPICAGKS